MTELRGPVRIVGTGLIGTSIGLALARLGVVVELVDADPDNALMAERIGAGSRLVQIEPQLVVVAVPPDHVGAVIAEQLEQTTQSSPMLQREVEAARRRAESSPGTSAGTSAVTRWPAPSERAARRPRGPLRRRDLGDHSARDQSTRGDRAGTSARRGGRSPDRRAVCRGPRPRRRPGVTPAAPDVGARRGHARRRADLAPELSGQGVRDVTRIAAGDPKLWTQIVSANSTALTGLLEQIRGELDRLLVALGKEEAAEELTSILGPGVSGAVRVPGKHGAPHIDLVTVW